MGTFFEIFKHRHWTNFQDVGSISNATAIQCHIWNLLFDFRQITAISIRSNKRTTRTLQVSTFVSLLAFVGLTMLDDIIAATIWT
jgi:hypothetical protein